MSGIIFRLILLFAFFIQSSTFLDGQENLSLDFKPFVYFIKVDLEDGIYQLNYEIELQNDEGESIEFSTRSQDQFLEILLGDLYHSEPLKDDLFIFIHGMWGSRKMVFRNTIDELLEAYVKPPDSPIAKVISIQWPGNEWSYWKNRTKASNTSEMLADELVKMIRTIQIINWMNRKLESNILMMCHSMGNYLFEQMVQSMENNEFRYPLLQELILAAPDLDGAAFAEGKKLRKINMLSERVHVYFNRKDLTLKVSKDLNDIRRMGLTGPNINTRPVPGIFFVDVTDVNDDFKFSARLSKHFYYRTSPLVTKDMLEVLKRSHISSFDQRTMSNRPDEYLLISGDD
jgi:hypothetical protein